MAFEYFRGKKQKKEARQAYLASLRNDKPRLKKGPAQIITQSYSKLPKPTIEIPEFKPGRIYFIEEPKYDLTARLVKAHPFPVLWVDKIKPEHIMQDYNLKKSKNLDFIWMTDIKNIDSAMAVSLEYIRQEHNNFLKKNDNGLFVLGGLHNLIERHGFDQVRKVCDSLSDNLSTYDGFVQVLMPVNPKTIKKEYLDKLEQGREVIK